MEALPRRTTRPTRGSGKLEAFICRLRMGAALKAINPALHGTEILDIGCGNYPLFLLNAPFSRRVGVDQLDPVQILQNPPSMRRLPGLDGPANGNRPGELELSRLSLSGTVRLPYPDETFSCVSSLAVIEHLEPQDLPSLMTEIRRVLKPSGQLILTTPHAFADGILRAMAHLRLVSKEEIAEHKNLFLHRNIRQLLAQAGFPKDRIRVGGFMLGLNILAVAEK